jgi:large subunit ribosomal protein L29
MKDKDSNDIPELKSKDLKEKVVPKATHLREKSVPELEDLLRDNSKELVDLRIRKETGQIEKPHMIKVLRREIARIKTLLEEKRDSILTEDDSSSEGRIPLRTIARRSGVSHRKVLRAIAKAS